MIFDAIMYTDLLRSYVNEFWSASKYIYCVKGNAAIIGMWLAGQILPVLFKFGTQPT